MIVNRRADRLCPEVDNIWGEEIYSLMSCCNTLETTQLLCLQVFDPHALCVHLFAFPGLKHLLVDSLLKQPVYYDPSLMSAVTQRTGVYKTETKRKRACEDQ